MTHFTVQCNSWRDTDTPLTYKISHTMSAGGPDDELYLVYHGQEATPPPFVLPPGQHKDNFTYNITVNVEDIFGSASVVTLQVQVCYIELNK